MTKRSNGKRPSTKVPKSEAAGASLREIREDLRIRRTKRLLQNALFDLIMEKDYDAISIDDIVTRAMVGKSTLYAHFHGKEDLLRSGLVTRVRSFIKISFPVANAGLGQEVDPAPSLFKRIAFDRKLAKPLLHGRKVPAVEEFVLEEFQKQLKAFWIERSEEQDPFLIEAAAVFASNGMLGLILWWIEADRPPAPEVMDDLYKRLIRKGLESAGPGFVFPF